MLAGRAEESAERNIKESLKKLNFLPHEEVEAQTLALLAAHRALSEQEKLAAMASARDNLRRAAAREDVEGLSLIHI